MFVLSFPLSLLVSLGDFLLSWGTFPLTESSSHRGPFRHKLSQTLQAILAVTLCVLCMPKAFCGFETVRQKAPWTLCALWEKKLPGVREMLTHTSCQQASRGNLTYYAPPCGGGVGGGATIFWARTCAQKSSVRSVSSVRERNVLSERKKCP